jgi:peptidoglycan/LPS O-acetylase OafA/YrhL
MQAFQRKIKEIEVLRAVAILFTLYQHIGWLVPSAGWAVPHFAFWSGVDLFFVISGFVISRTLLRERLDGRALISFWIRRAWRILPSAWLWLAIVLAATVAFNRSGAFGDLTSNSRDTVAAVLQVANLHYVACGSLRWYECGVDAPYWSLSLEEQFYVWLPLFLMLAGSKRVATVALLVLAAIQIMTHRNAGYALLNMTKSDGLMLGVLIAIFSTTHAYKWIEPTALRVGRIRWPVFVGLVGALAWLPAHTLSTPFYMGRITLVAGALVLIASYGDGLLMADGLARRWLVVIGSRSYGLYLIHIPTYLFTRELFFRLVPDAPAFSQCLTAIVILAALSEANYRLVETPLRDYGRRLSDGRFKLETIGTVNPA